MIIPAIIKGEKEEEDASTPLVRRKLNTDDAVQKSVLEPILMSDNMLASTTLEQVEKHSETSEAMVREVADVGVDLENAEVQATEVIAGLKSAETEASSIPEVVVSEVVIEENLDTSEATDTGMTGINLKSILEDDFDYATLNHKSQTPSPNLSLSYTLSPVGESTIVQNQLTLFST